MEKHIQKFTIHAYKGIQNLTLDHLNLINILTGDNNSGKTSIFEYLSFFNFGGKSYGVCYVIGIYISIRYFFFFIINRRQYVLSLF